MARPKPSGKSTLVTMTGVWSDGSEPSWIAGVQLNLDTGEFDFFDAVGGTVTMDLAPGRYSFISYMVLEAGEKPSAITSINDVTASGESIDVPVDGRRAIPVEFDVDRHPVESRQREVTLFGYEPDSPFKISAGVRVDGDQDVSVIPTDELHDHGAGMVVREELASPHETAGADPYSYSLFEVVENGIPADLMLEVDHEDLAIREMDYRSLGADSESVRLNLSYHPEFTPYGYMHAGSVPVPSHRTEYYTADPKVSWYHIGELTSTDGTTEDDVLRAGSVMTPGSVEEVSWHHAPLSVGTGDPTFGYYTSGIVRDRQALEGIPAMFNGGTDGEVIASNTITGNAVLLRDGEELAATDHPGLYVVLPEGDGGRYTLAVEATRDVPWTPLGTRSSAEWQFESSQTTEATPLDVSSVRFQAEGVIDGYASAGTSQDVTLEYVTQSGAARQECVAMTFEVSHDDGATWQPVDIDRDGDIATATLDLPSDPGFVSVRFTAEDTGGNTVTTETIRSYGLR